MLTISDHAVMEEKERELREQAQEKAHELRTVVGESYRTLLDSADRIVGMGELAQSVLEQLAQLEVSFNALSKPPRMASHTQSLSRSHSTQELQEDDVEDESVGVWRQLGVACEEVWRCLHENRCLEAASYILELAMRVRSSGCEESRGTLYQQRHLLEFLSMPLVVYRHALSRVGRADLSCEQVMDALLCLSFLPCDAPSDVASLLRFHSQRRQHALSSEELLSVLLDTRVDSVKKVLESVLQAVQTSREADSPSHAVCHSLAAVCTSIANTLSLVPSLFLRELPEYLVSAVCPAAFRGLSVEVPSEDTVCTILGQWSERVKRDVTPLVGSVLACSPNAVALAQARDAALAECSGDMWADFLHQPYSATAVATVSRLFASLSNLNHQDADQSPQCMASESCESFSSCLQRSVAHCQALLEVPDEVPECVQVFASQSLHGTARSACVAALERVAQSLRSDVNEAGVECGEQPVSISAEAREQHLVFLHLLCARMPRRVPVVLDGWLDMEHLEGVCQSLRDSATMSLQHLSVCVAGPACAQLRQHAKQWRQAREEVFQGHAVGKSTWREVDTSSLPCQASPHALSFVFRVCCHVQRLLVVPSQQEGVQAGREISAALSTMFRHIFRLALEALRGCLTDFQGDGEQLQALLDAGFILDVLHAGDAELQEEACAFIESLSAATPLDPIDWQFLKSHATQFRALLYHRSSVLLGCATQLSRLHSEVSPTMARSTAAPGPPVTVPVARPLPFIPSLPVGAYRSRKVARSRPASTVSSPTSTISASSTKYTPTSARVGMGSVGAGKKEQAIAAVMELRKFAGHYFS